MIPLSRKIHESVVIGHPNRTELLVKVTVLEIKEGNVVLGFETEEDFPVEPWEVWERIRAGASASVSKEKNTCPHSEHRGHKP